MASTLDVESVKRWFIEASRDEVHILFLDLCLLITWFREELERWCAEALDSQKEALENYKKQIQGLKDSYEASRKESEATGRRLAEEEAKARLVDYQKEIQGLKDSHEASRKEAENCAEAKLLNIYGPLPQKGPNLNRGSTDGKIGEKQSVSLLRAVEKKIQDNKRWIICSSFPDSLPGDYSIETKVSPLSPSTGNANEFDAKIRVEIRNHLTGDNSILELRIESKEGSNSHVAYANDVLSQLSNLRDKPENKNVKIQVVFVAWNQRVSDPDHEKLETRGVKVYDNANDLSTYTDMISGVYHLLLTMISKVHDSQYNIEDYKQRDSDHRRMCDNTYAQAVHNIAELTQKVWFMATKPDFWFELFKKSRCGDGLLDAFKKINDNLKRGAKKPIWPQEFQEQIPGCFTFSKKRKARCGETGHDLTAQESGASASGAFSLCSSVCLNGRTSGER